MNPILIVILITVLPWLELRAGIPVGILVCHLDPLLVVAVATVVNSLVFFPVYFGLEFIYTRVQHILFIKRNLQLIKKRGEASVRKYGAIGLAIFVAIPLPFTGAYTGSAMAWLLGMDWKRSFASVALGVIGAAIIVTLLTLFFGAFIPTESLSCDF